MSSVTEALGHKKHNFIPTQDKPLDKKRTTPSPPKTSQWRMTANAHPPMLGATPFHVSTQRWSDDSKQD